MQILSCALALSCCIWAAVAHNHDGQGTSEAGRSKSVWEEPIQFLTKTKDRCSMVLTGHEGLTRLRVSCVGQEASYWCEYEGKPDICRNYNTNPRHFFTQVMWELRKQNNACQGPRSIKPTMCKKASGESQMVLTTASSAAVAPRPLKPQATQATQTTAAKQEQPKTEQAKPESPTSAPRFDQAKPEQKPNNARQKPIRQKPARPQPTRPQPTRPQPAKPAKAKTEQVKTEPAKPVASKPATKITPPLKKVLAPKAATQAPTRTSPVPTRLAENLAQQYCWHGMQDFCTKIIGWFTK